MADQPFQITAAVLDTVRNLSAEGFKAREIAPHLGIILICANIHIRHVRSFLKHKEHHSGIAFLLADSKLILLNSFP